MLALKFKVHFREPKMNMTTAFTKKRIWYKLNVTTGQNTATKCHSYLGTDVFFLGKSLTSL